MRKNKMIIYINDIQKNYSENSLTVENILIKEKIENKNIAVAINMKVIKQLDYSQTILKNGDKIDIVIPFHGG
jgi:thiamine biosynthesis protein ThiS